jgi:hypothetical protein
MLPVAKASKRTYFTHGKAEHLIFVEVNLK